MWKTAFSTKLQSGGVFVKIYDITQELFHCVVFPGDPKPEKEAVLRIEDGAVCNLTKVSLCAHNGTHVDAPWHFCRDGKTVEQISLDKFVGKCYVAEVAGELKAEDAEKLLQEAKNADPEAAKRLLMKGTAFVSVGAAKVFAEAGIWLFGNESQTVGPEDAPAEVHHILLGAEVVLLEGIRLCEVPEGVYLLNAAPINLGGCDGAPCRAILMEL